MNILWAAKTGDSNAWYHIMPFKMTSFINKIHVCRYKKPQRELKGVELHNFNHSNIIIELVNYTLTCLNICRKEKIDLIVTFNPFPWGIISFIIAKIYGKPIMMGLIGGELDPARTNKIKLKILKIILKHVTIITVTGSKTKALLTSLGYQENKIHVFPHLADQKHLKFKKNKNYEADILTITSFLPLKRTKDIIKAMSIILAKGYNLKLAVLGKGPELSETKELVNKLGLENNITFHGYVKDIRPYINNCKYFIQTSSNEGLSLALVESMAVGLIPIVTNVGDENEIITDGQEGYFIPVGRPEEIAKKIIYLNNNCTKKIESHIKRKMKFFNIENSNMHMEIILNRLIRG